MEIAVAHHLVAAEHLGVELERTIHVLDRDAKVLHALQPRAERRIVARSRALPSAPDRRQCLRERERFTSAAAGSAAMAAHPRRVAVRSAIEACARIDVIAFI